MYSKLKMHMVVRCLHRRPPLVWDSDCHHIQTLCAMIFNDFAMVSNDIVMISSDFSMVSSEFVRISNDLQ